MARRYSRAQPTPTEAARTRIAESDAEAPAVAVLERLEALGYAAKSEPESSAATPAASPPTAAGQDLRAAGRIAALAVMDSVLDVRSVEASEERSVRVEGSDGAELLVNWLNEVLFLFEVEGFVTARVRIGSLTESTLQATCWGEEFDSSRHRTKTEVKAVTHHRLRLEEVDGGWIGEFLCDL